MAFIVEDGNGLADANSYISVAEFQAYHQDRGRDVSGLSQQQVETACVRGTDYIDKRFGGKFLGFPQSSSQALEWPRLDAIDDDGYLLDGLPRQLRHACAEYALRAHTLGELAPDPELQFPTRDATGDGNSTSVGQVVRKREKVGPIEEETEYGTVNKSSYQSNASYGGVPLANIPAYPAADLLLADLTENTRSLSRG